MCACVWWGGRGLTLQRGRTGWRGVGRGARDTRDDGASLEDRFVVCEERGRREAVWAAIWLREMLAGDSEVKAYPRGDGAQRAASTTVFSLRHRKMGEPRTGGNWELRPATLDRCKQHRPLTAAFCRLWGHFLTMGPPAAERSDTSLLIGVDKIREDKREDETREAAAATKRPPAATLEPLAKHQERAQAQNLEAHFISFFCRSEVAFLYARGASLRPGHPARSPQPVDWDPS